MSSGEMTRPAVRLALIGGIFLASPASFASDVEELVPLVKHESVLVSFRIGDAFNEELNRAIESGLAVSFRYDVELKRVRRLWFNARLAEREVVVTVTYDNLTERYSLTREIDGEIDATEVVRDVEAMRRFMTTFDSLELFETSLMKPNEEYYLQVEGVMKERNLFLFIPWDVGSGSRKAYFTYLPERSR